MSFFRVSLFTANALVVRTAEVRSGMKLESVFFSGRILIAYRQMLLPIHQPLHTSLAPSHYNYLVQLLSHYWQKQILTELRVQVQDNKLEYIHLNGDNVGKSTHSSLNARQNGQLQHHITYISTSHQGDISEH